MAGTDPSPFSGPSGAALTAAIFPGVRLQFPSTGAEAARARVWQLGTARLVRVEDAALRLERQVRQADAAARTFKLLVQSRGSARLEHAGRTAWLAAGDWALIDGARSFRLELSPAYAQLVLELPRDVVMRRARELLALAGLPSRRDCAEHTLLASHVEAVARHVEQVRPERRCQLVDPIIGLLASLAAPDGAGESMSQRRFLRACGDLEANLSDPALSAGMLAGLQGISRRRLDAIFAARGLTPERMIWDRRLERIAIELTGEASRPLIDIAMAWGFNGASHFSHAFRRKYGQAPSAFRERHSRPAAEAAGPAGSQR